jgi:hypothetical protein
MAEIIVGKFSQSDESQVGPARTFSGDDAASLMRNVKATRAVLRAVGLAVGAQIDGAIAFEDNCVERWHPVLEEACQRLEGIRDVLMQTSDAPNINWFTPLNLVEAAAAALWRGHDCGELEGLKMAELETLAQVAVDSLDCLIEEFEKVRTLQQAPTGAAAH